MNQVSIIEVNNKKDLLRFIRFPDQLYKGNQYYVPQMHSDEVDSLSPDINPMLKDAEIKLFLALQEGQVVGRIGAILQHAYNQKTQQKRMRFTRFDFIDDKRVSAALMAAVEQFAKQKGMSLLHGPMGCSDLDKQGMLVEGFDEVGLNLTYYNYPYYIDHLQALGFEKEVDWLEFRFNMPTQLDPRIARITQAVKQRYGLKIPTYTSMKQIVVHADELFEVINKTYEKLYGVVPLTNQMAQYYVKHYLPFMSPDFISLVFNQQDKLVGFAIAAPSLSVGMQKSKGKLFPFGAIHLLNALRNPVGLDLYYMGVLPEYQSKGVSAIMMNDIIQRAIQRGIQWAETGPQLEENHKIQNQFKHFEGRQHKRRRCFVKNISL